MWFVAPVVLLPADYKSGILTLYEYFKLLSLPPSESSHPSLVLESGYSFFYCFIVLFWLQVEEEDTFKITCYSLYLCYKRLHVKRCSY